MQMQNLIFQHFIFEASVEGTTFSKDSHDMRFHHRDQALTRYYQDILDFERGR
jgi:hypothetical protein